MCNYLTPIYHQHMRRSVQLNMYMQGGRHLIVNSNRSAVETFQRVAFCKCSKCFHYVKILIQRMFSSITAKIHIFK